MSTELCPCGLPLHYEKPESQAYVERVIELQGPDQRITVSGLGTWMVPRHYVALHGVTGGDIPELAKRFGWATA